MSRYYVRTLTDLLERTPSGAERYTKAYSERMLSAEAKVNAQPPAPPVD